MSALRSDDQRRTILLAWLTEKEGKGKSHEKYLSSSVLAALGSRGKEALPFLLDLAASFEYIPNDFIREDVVKLLGAFGDDSELAKKALLSALHDKNPYVQVAAIKGLERIDKESDKTNAAILDLFHKTALPQVRLAAQSSLFAQAPTTFSKTESLSPSDKEFNNKFCKIYTITFEKANVYKIDMMSSSIDSFLYVKKGDTILGFDDDGGEGLNARLFFEPKETGDYEVWATTFPTRAVGEFTLEIRRLEKKHKTPVEAK